MYNVIERNPHLSNHRLEGGPVHIWSFRIARPGDPDLELAKVHLETSKSRYNSVSYPINANHARNHETEDS